MTDRDPSISPNAILKASDVRIVHQRKINGFDKDMLIGAGFLLAATSQKATMVGERMRSLMNTAAIGVLSSWASRYFSKHDPF